METIRCQNGNVVQWFATSTPQGIRGIVQVWREDILHITLPTYDFFIARDIAKLLVKDYNTQQSSSDTIEDQRFLSLVSNDEPFGTIEKQLLEAFGGGPEFR